MIFLVLRTCLRGNLVRSSSPVIKPCISGPIGLITTRFEFQPRRWITVGLNSLRPARGSKKPRKRVGRGIGSGGRTCGRGHGGQKSRSGPGIPRGFEGGQTPFYLRVPKRGARPEEPDYSRVGLDRVQHLIDTGRLDPKLPITLRHLREAGINFSSDGGASRFQSTLVCLQATCFEEKAIRRIEQFGGLPVSVFHDSLGLRWMKRPYAPALHKHLSPPPTLKARVFYSSWEQRGYLHPDVQRRLLQADPSFIKRYCLAKPMSLPDKTIFDLRKIPDELCREGILPA